MLCSLLLWHYVDQQALLLNEHVAKANFRSVNFDTKIRDAYLPRGGSDSSGLLKGSVQAWVTPHLERHI